MLAWVAGATRTMVAKFVKLKELISAKVKKYPPGWVKRGQSKQALVSLNLHDISLPVL